MDELSRILDSDRGWETDGMQSWFRLRIVHLLLNKVFNWRVEQKGINAAYVSVLKALKDGTEKIPSELRQHSLAGISNLTGLIDRMERDGLAERGLDSSDRRKRPIRLTQAGMQVAAEMIPFHDDYIRQQLQVLTEHDRRELDRILGILWEHFSEEAHLLGMRGPLPGE